MEEQRGAPRAPAGPFHDVAVVQCRPCERRGAGAPSHTHANTRSDGCAGNVAVPPRYYHCCCAGLPPRPTGTLSCKPLLRRPRAQLITTVIEAERPQLVVLSGDIVSGAFWDGRPGWAEAA